MSSRSSQFRDANSLSLAPSFPTPIKTATLRHLLGQGQTGGHSLTPETRSPSLDKPSNFQADRTLPLRARSCPLLGGRFSFWLGGHTETSSASGIWSPLEKSLHINILEIRAVRYSLLQLNLSHLPIHLFIDNAPAQCAINKLSCKSLNLLREIKFLLVLLKERSLKIKAFRISTLLNSKADALSRTSHPLLEWKLP